MEKRYGERGLIIVGIHTPEFENERRRKNVEAAVAEHHLDAHSHLLDNEMQYWSALRNEFWPAIYFVDRCRRIQKLVVGEIHIGTTRDKELQTLMERLLTESPEACAAK